MTTVTTTHTSVSAQGRSLKAREPGSEPAMSTTGVVYVVDDDPDICVLVESTLRTAGIDSQRFDSVETLLPAVPSITAEQAPHCLLLDLMMPGKSGLEFLESHKPQSRCCPVIIMTAKGTVSNAVRSMQLGAVDFLEKPFSPEDLLARVRTALQLSAENLVKQAEVNAVRDRVATLSRRERELLDAIVAGNSTKMVADTLGISARTVDHHRASLMEKMKAGNVADLVRMVVEADYKSV
jgi:two-component system, LuxR family, response regulator FixJ